MHTVKTGLEQLVNEPERWVKGLRVGLIAHPASILPDLRDAAGSLLRAGVRLTTLFSAEHGLTGTADSEVPHSTDPTTGLPVYSLYGDTFQPAPEMLSEVDLLLFDMQDVGVRFFTYISTLYYALKGAAQSGRPVLVLDRPNPITGVHVEGQRVQPGYESFVGIAALPIRHGLTLGEAARFLSDEYNLRADLRVLPMLGWQRSHWFDQTGLPWVPPSPAMPHLGTATVYPGTCLLEGTNLSEGRGTYQPFELCGAPWIDGGKLEYRLNGLGLPGVRFRQAAFKPHSSKYGGEICHGVQVHVMDREIFRPTRAALHLLSVVYELYPDKLSWNAHFDHLAGTDQVRRLINAGGNIEDLVNSWTLEEETFENLRARYLLY